MPESIEHKHVKDLITERLIAWTGASLSEYNSSGHELDVLAVTKDGISVYVEIVWSASAANYYRDMNMLQQSDADVKAVVVGPDVWDKEEYVREFSKIAISQRRNGVQIWGELIEGTRLLQDSRYLDVTFKEIILNLVLQIRLYGRLIKEREFIPPSCPIVDRVPELLLTNLFPVVKYPEKIYCVPTSAREEGEVIQDIGSNVSGHPFFLKEKMLFSFDNPKTNSPFIPIISTEGFIEESTEEYKRDNIKRNDFIRMLNFALRSLCQERGMYYDKVYHRYVCQLWRGRDNIFTYRSRSRLTTRAVAKWVFSESGTFLYCRHYTADLGFMFIGDRIFLKIEPSMTWTKDGYQPLGREELVRRSGRSLRRQFNDAFLQYVRFWAKYLSKRGSLITIPVGEQSLEIETRPAGTRIEIGIANEEPSHFG